MRGRREELGANKRVAKTCQCESCRKARGEASKIAWGVVYDYSSRPYGGWKAKYTKAEKFGPPDPFAPNGTYCMGVELETMLPDVALPRPRRTEPEPPYPREGLRFGDEADREEWTRLSTEWQAWDRRHTDAYDDWQRQRDEMRRNMLSAEEATSMARPRNLWLPKHDGSVSGPEFASQPASLAWWQSREPQLANMFTQLLHAGLRSHEGDQAGMHVNIGSAAFRSAEHLFRFAKLLNDNSGWSQRMSQRTLSSTSDWARLGNRPFDNDYHMRNWAREVYNEGSGNNDRYSALNALNEGRLEFRLPRGTLRLDRFYKNLEWTHAMIEYTRPHDGIGALTSAEFMRWVMTDPMAMLHYPNLRAFLTEKFASRATVRDNIVAA